MQHRFQRLHFDGTPNSAFTSGIAQISGGAFSGKYYQTVAFGQPVHGLNIGGLVINNKDFVSPVNYAVSFRIRSDQTEKALAGDVLTNIDMYQKKLQIDGFRCGDINVLRVPDFTATRNGDATTADFDRSNHLSWKPYALLSGRQHFAFGKPLGKNAWLCSFGVGRTYRVEFLSSNLSPNQSRLFTFRVTQYGVFGIPVTVQDITYDSKIKDYVGTTSSDILTSIIFPNLRGTEAWRFEDASTNGQKALIAGYYHSSAGFEDDGVNDATTSPVVWLEFTFTQPGGTELQITHRVVRNFTQLNADSGYNIIENVPITSAMAGPPELEHKPPMRLISLNSLKTTPGDGGSTTTTAWRVFEFNEDGALTILQEGLPDGSFGGDYSVLTPKPGYWEGTVVGGNAIKRVIHICYNQDGLLVEAKSTYETVSGNILEVISATYSGSLSVSVSLGENNQPVYTGSGSMTSVIVKERYFYRRTSFGLLVGGIEVAKLSTEIGGDKTRETSTVIRNWDGTKSSTVTNTAQPEQYSNTPQLPVSNISPSIGMGFSTLNSRQTASYFRAHSEPLEEPGGKVWPFIRVESNTIVSFNIGRGGYSMGVDAQGGGVNGQFVITYPVLAVGKHLYRRVYNMYKGADQGNTDNEFGQTANPAYEIDGAKFYCTYNPATEESILNAEDACVFV